MCICHIPCVRMMHAGFGSEAQTQKGLFCHEKMGDRVYIMFCVLKKGVRAISILSGFNLFLFFCFNCFWGFSWKYFNKLSYFRIVLDL